MSYTLCSGVAGLCEPYFSTYRSKMNAVYFYTYIAPWIIYTCIYTANSTKYTVYISPNALLSTCTHADVAADWSKNINMIQFAYNNIIQYLV